MKSWLGPWFGSKRMRLPKWTPLDMSRTSLLDYLGEIETKPSKRVDYFIDNIISTQMGKEIGILVGWEKHILILWVFVRMLLFWLNQGFFRTNIIIINGRKERTRHCPQNLLQLPNDRFLPRRLLQDWSLRLWKAPSLCIGDLIVPRILEIQRKRSLQVCPWVWIPRIIARRQVVPLRNAMAWSSSGWTRPEDRSRGFSLETSRVY